MAIKTITCSSKDCPTPEIVYTEDLPPSYIADVTLFKSVRTDSEDPNKTFITEELLKQVNHDKDILTKEHLKDLDVTPIIKKVLEETKSEDNDEFKDYMVIYCKTGHRNYIPIKNGKQ